MKLKTEVFGEIEYSEDNIIVFKDGLYGFKDKSEFIYIPSEDEGFQFNWLQSIDDPNLTFIVTDPFLFVEKYDFDVEDHVIGELEINSPEDLSILSIVNIGDDVEETTVNIKAPILINHHTRSGQQVILNEDYPFKYFIFKKEMNEEK